MKKKLIDYSSLSNQELEKLKDTYVRNKINKMSNEECKKFVFEIINHQIKDTIGNEEELEAWKEMESFFGDDFDQIIKKIQIETKSLEDQNKDLKTSSEQISKTNELNIEKNEKVDMWDD